MSTWNFNDDSLASTFLVGSDLTVKTRPTTAGNPAFTSMTVWLMSDADRSRAPQGGILAVAVLGVSNDEQVGLGRWLTPVITDVGAANGLTAATT